MHASPPSPAAPSEQPGPAPEQPGSSAAQPAAPEQPEAILPPRPGPRSALLAGGMLATSLLLAGLVVLPAPYAVQMPGPTADVLGEQNGTPLITIKGATTYPTTGQLRLTTVSATGTPGFPSSVANVVRAWLSRSDLVVPTEELVPPGQTQQQLNDLNNQEMTSSQENATVAALTELGYTVPATLTVAGTTGGTDAAGKLKAGDVLTAIDGTKLGDYQALVTTLGKVKPGATITLGITRGGTGMDVPVVTGTRSDGSGALIGVFIDPTFTFPIDVKIQIDGIGGPSAGMMFALGIVDRLTPADETNGQRIAGTGTIDVTGAVGPIGGIRQKMAGALRDGATWFLAPKANCGDVTGHVPAGLRVVAVATLHDAVAAVTAIGKGTGSSLPTCG
ncbi:MAG: signal protein PDZ [Cellulomonas sp. 73-92]|uniref:YlbL family protein n=1 Tax=Cellulomonas sp. 73-92 TaxID=1895740 RepID=UPI00092C66E3|nr:S16 family serine protease [Cellulomonas sp. 73-92]OJV82224.1 MAG: signal protein PDZ [Cellulomonas sp. 73-92]